MTRLLALPRSFDVYVCSPAESLGKARDWLNAHWQLRGCTRVGRLTRVAGRVHVNNSGAIVLGERVRIDSRHSRSLLTAFRGGRLEIGAGTFLNYGADISATELVRIGDNCLIGTHCMILDSDFHDLTDRNRLPASRPVIVEDRVWLGNRVILLPGTRIGEGSVIGAGSVVKGEIPAHSVAAGNPARVIKQLPKANKEDRS